LLLFKPMRFLWILLFLLTAQAFADGGRSLLDTALADTSLSRQAVKMISRHLPAEALTSITVRDVVALRRSTLDDEVFTGYGYEVDEFLQSHGLRFGLTEAEIEFYGGNGRLPPMTGDSYIEALGLSAWARHVLEKMGVVHIDDTDDIDLEEVADVKNAGRVVMKELTVAFAQNGLGGPSKGRFSPLRGLGVEAKTAIALSNVGINSLDGLKSLTLIEIENLPGIGKAARPRLLTFMRRHGIRPADDVLERAIRERIPLDLSLPILGHVRIRTIERQQYLGLRLGTQRIATLKDLLNLRRFDQAREPLFTASQVEELNRIYGRLDLALKKGNRCTTDLVRPEITADGPFRPTRNLNNIGTLIDDADWKDPL
jgi:hypothetical protein